MFPAMTDSPPNFFTPKRLLRESRPFLTDPCPFLCAIVSENFSCEVFSRPIFKKRSDLAVDAGDFQFGHVAAEAFGFVVTLAALELESDTLGSAKLVEHFGGNGSTINDRAANPNGASVIDHQYLVESCLGVYFEVELLDVDLIASRHAVLLASGLDHCVCHGLI